MFYPSYYSLTNFTATIFAGMAGIFLLTLRSRSTRYMGLGFLSVSAFSAFYVIAFSLYTPAAAFHRWGTVGLIFVSMTFWTQFYIRFPGDANQRFGRLAFAALAAFALLIFVYFAHSSMSAQQRFVLSGHYWDFQMPDQSRVVGIAIMLYVLTWIGIIVWRFRTSQGRERTAFFQNLMVIFLAIVPLTFLNYFTYEGYVTRRFFSTIMSTLLIVAFFLIIIIYLNVTQDKTTIQTKIVGITVVTILVFLTGMSHIVMRAHTSSFSEVLRGHAQAAIAGTRGRALYVQPVEKRAGDPKPALDLKSLDTLPDFQKQKTDVDSGSIFFREILRDGGPQHVVSIRVTDPRSKRLTEVGFPYLDYREHEKAMVIPLAVVIVTLLAAIMFIFPLFFRGSLMNPLRALLEGVTQVNQGNLRVEVPVTVEDEIGFVARSFNKMVASVRESQETLEERVAERTRDLAATTDNLQEAYDKLQEMDNLKTNFFANISHELRTPLTLILSPMESFIQGELGSLTDAQKDTIVAVHRNGQKLLKLINNLLDFSKIEAGKMSVAYREVNLTGYVRELTAAFDSAARTRGLSLSVESASDRLHAFIDTDKMEKVLLNLLSNAFKFTQTGGISLAVSENNGNVRISVNDTGIGIPSDKLESVFERFSQVDGSASRRYEGTGIGLALARELVQLHRGTLTASSTPGQGSSFLVEFPRTPAGLDAREVAQTDTAVSVTRAAVLNEVSAGVDQTVRLTDESGETAEVVIENGGPAERRPERVLLVEDTHDMRKFLFFLTNPHFHVSTARNGREGLEKARKLKPDLILSDVMMPEMNGYQLLAALRDDPELQATPVILLTAKADVTMKIDGLDRGADDYIVKPFNSRELLARIRSQLRMSGLQKEVASMRDRLQDMNEKLTGQIQAQVSDLIQSEKFRHYLPPQLVDALLEKRHEQGSRFDRKELTIFFSDIVNFTRITEDMDPEKLHVLLNDYLSEMTIIARKFNGTIDKFVGDAILIHFGHYGSRGVEEDARLCTAMAVEMQLRMRELAAVWIERGFAEPFQIRCGVNTGFAAVGDFGSNERMDYTVIGSNVNLASRIQAQAEPGGILVSHATWALTRRHFQMEPAFDLEAKGFYKKVPVYRVLF